MIGWRRDSAQNASRFSVMGRDGDGRIRDLLDLRVKSGWSACLVLYTVNKNSEIEKRFLDLHLIRIWKRG